MKVCYAAAVLGASYALTVISVIVLHHRSGGPDVIPANNPNSLVPLIPAQQRQSKVAEEGIALNSGHDDKPGSLHIKAKVKSSGGGTAGLRAAIANKANSPSIGDGGGGGLRATTNAIQVANPPQAKEQKKPFKAKNQFAFVSLAKGGKQTIQLGKKNPNTVERTYSRLNIGKRFPMFATAEFDARCPWVKPAKQQDMADTGSPGCTIFVRNREGGNEGVSMWASQLAHGFIHAQQAGCRFRADYDGNVEVDRVLLPVDEVNNDWRVASDFTCEESSGCISMQLTGNAQIRFPGGKIPNRPVTEKPANVPNYRWAYSGNEKFQMYRSKFANLHQRLPGFRIEDGMACALNSLFKFAPSAAEFEPRLFSEILPAVRDTNALVLSLYVRTGRTDEVAAKEEAGDGNAQALEENVKYNYLEDIVECAQSVEEQHLNDAGAKIDRIIWLVISDGPKLKQHVVDKYEGQDVASSTSPTAAQRTVPRSVVVTGARGIHTRPRRKPSTNEFAEAMIDWMLIGESDALIANPQLSFGFTGALRNNLPFFDANDDCGRRIMVLDG